MKITNLRPLSSGGRDTTPAGDVSIRGTESQDIAVEAKPDRTRQKMIGLAAGALIVVLLFGLLIRGWSSTEHTIARERLRIATVTEGAFVRDVSAQGTVVAAVSPTLFAVAPGNISYAVRAGDTVTEGQVLATLVSPTLESEYQRERATLESLDTALQRQSIEIRRQKLATKEAADLANVQIRAADRELQRAQSAWDKGAIAERDLRRAEDERESAKLAYDHAMETSGLEQESLDLDLRAKRQERERQGFVVSNLKRQVDELSVRAPVNGMVANLAAAEKASVAENAPLLTVVDLSAFEVEFQVADVYARDIKAGMESEISLDGHDYKGLVTGISPEVRSGQVTGRVKFAGEQPPSLRQSQRGSVRIVIEQRAKAMKFERSSDIVSGTRAVYVVDGDQAILTPVELGAASVGEIEVLKGLKPGQEVVISGTGDMKDVPEFHIGG
ncbi:MAG TPA: HlyD family efflux transporter periplasmic adaptor subunit [Steroidobacteraceae bacterium]